MGQRFVSLAAFKMGGLPLRRLAEEFLKSGSPTHLKSYQVGQTLLIAAACANPPRTTYPCYQVRQCTAGKKEEEEEEAGGEAKLVSTISNFRVNLKDIAVIQLEGQEG